MQSICNGILVAVLCARIELFQQAASGALRGPSRRRVPAGHGDVDPAEAKAARHRQKLQECAACITGTALPRNDGIADVPEAVSRKLGRSVLPPQIDFTRVLPVRDPVALPGRRGTALPSSSTTGAPLP